LDKFHLSRLGRCHFHLPGRALCVYNLCVQTLRSTGEAAAEQRKPNTLLVLVTQFAAAQWQIAPTSSRTLSYCILTPTMRLCAGWYVVIDNHLNADNTAIDNPKLWLSSWGRIMSAIAADPISSKFVMYDILNEPGSKQLNWIGSGGRMGITDYYTQMMDQGFKINPKAVYLIEVTNPPYHCRNQTLFKQFRSLSTRWFPHDLRADQCV
jgi:hypothetical protein